jgi:hypothetical protein
VKNNKKKGDVRPARRLVDRLVSPPADGSLIAILATTYELQAEFLETDFLPSLLGLGAWDDRNWTSRIAIEKSLADTESAAVFMDTACYRGRPRSLRLSIHPVAVGRGRILHAKVTLLVYDRAVRLIVGSANLTEPGYRKNREVAATLRATPGRFFPRRSTVSKSSAERAGCMRRSPCWKGMPTRWRTSDRRTSRSMAGGSATGCLPTSRPGSSCAHAARTALRSPGSFPGSPVPTSRSTGQRETS